MNTKKTAGEKLTIGLDLGDRRHQVCVLDASGKILAEEAIVNTHEVITAFVPDPAMVTLSGEEIFVPGGGGEVVEAGGRARGAAHAEARAHAPIPRRQKTAVGVVADFLPRAALVLDREPETIAVEARDGDR